MFGPHKLKQLLLFVSFRSRPGGIYWGHFDRPGVDRRPILSQDKDWYTNKNEVPDDASPVSPTTPANAVYDDTKELGRL